MTLLRCGIVGLPNVGKSTLFNALTQTMNAEVANYPFCTIDANVGRVSVPDDRLEKLAKIANSKEIIRSQIDFVDIAGLVRGASQGEGLGNKFLSHIREVDCILNVLRCFDDGNITHVESNIDPIRDRELIESELILADLESLERREQNLEKKARGGDRDSQEQLKLIKKVKKVLETGKMATAVILEKDEVKNFNMLQLLTGKKQFFVCNVGENDILTGNKYTDAVKAYCDENGYLCEIISAKIEAEVAALASEAEKQDFLGVLGLSEKGLDRIIGTAYGILDLISFFTVGEKETHSWTIKRGSKAPEAAGTIHSDFEKGFIRAETISYEDYVALGGEEACRLAGKIRLEGRDYAVRDGDIFHFRFNV